MILCRGSSAASNRYAIFCQCRLDEIGALKKTLLTNNQQLWRNFTSPWLHAGLFHLIINLSSVIFVGLHLEQEFGPCKNILWYILSLRKLFIGSWIDASISAVRIGVIYILSAITGSLFASLFIQDRPSVCSSGALVGLLGTLLSCLIRNWKSYTNKVLISYSFFPLISAVILYRISSSHFLLQFAGLLATLTILMTNLVLGLVPYINNFANIGGFMSGFLLGFVLMFKPQQEKLARNKGGLFDFDAKDIAKCRNSLDKPVQRSAALVIFGFLWVPSLYDACMVLSCSIFLCTQFHHELLLRLVIVV